METLPQNFLRHPRRHRRKPQTKNFSGNVLLLQSYCVLTALAIAARNRQASTSKIQSCMVDILIIFFSIHKHLINIPFVDDGQSSRNLRKLFVLPNIWRSIRKRPQMTRNTSFNFIPVSFLILSHDHCLYATPISWNSRMTIK